MDIIEKCYLEVISENRYEPDEVEEHVSNLKAMNVLAKDMPKIESDFLKANHFGCSLQYGMALYKMLSDQLVPCFIAITMEENPETMANTDMHFSVCYTRNSKICIADPVESVKRCGKGQYFDIPIDYYGLIQGTIWLFSPKGKHGNELFFEDFLCHPYKVIKAD